MTAAVHSPIRNERCVATGVRSSLAFGSILDPSGNVHAIAMTPKEKAETA
jgi:hypothetical protein